jgi:methylmalonyl-CoA mutase
MDELKKSGLFDEFPPVSTQEWEEKILEDLKGADYEKKLVWNTLEGIKIRPYYRTEDLENLSHVKSLPGEYPFVRGAGVNNNHWDIRQDIDEEDPVKANYLALRSLEKGADAVGLNVHEVENPESLAALLKGIKLDEKAVHFIHSRNYSVLFQYLAQFVEQSGFEKSEIKGSLNFDPLGYYLLYGKFYNSADENYREAAGLIRKGIEYLPLFDVISVNGQHYHNAGAHAVQELAFVLSQGNEYLNQITEQGIPVDDIAQRMQFTIAVGSSYFLEIARLRALKMLWAKIVEQYNPKSEASLKINIHAVTSGWNKSIYDSYVNMLRSTTETMAATIAGVNSMTVAPFDATYKKADEFSSRIARNQQIVLKNESYFDKVADPAAGSYYIEKITDSIAEAAWKLFVQTEEMGGFVKAVESGFIKSEIEKTCQKRDMEIALRRQVFVGVNQYPNLKERMLDKIQPTAKPGDLGNLRPYRGMQAFEALRMSVENHERKGFEIPKVYLFTWGNLAMRKARATFATNFFGCAGYKIEEAQSVAALEEGTRQAIESGADVLVLCSSDEDYADMTNAVSYIREKSPKTLIVVAGNPTDSMEQLNQAGVQHYIHLRTNTLESLQRFNDLLGIA